MSNCTRVRLCKSKRSCVQTRCAKSRPSSAVTVRHGYLFVLLQVCWRLRTQYFHFFALLSHVVQFTRNDRLRELLCNSLERLHPYSSVFWSSALTVWPSTIRSLSPVLSFSMKRFILADIRLSPTLTSSFPSILSASLPF